MQDSTSWLAITANAFTRLHELQKDDFKWDPFELDELQITHRLRARWWSFRAHQAWSRAALWLERAQNYRQVLKESKVETSTTQEQTYSAVSIDFRGHENQGWVNVATECPPHNASTPHLQNVRHGLVPRHFRQGCAWWWGWARRRQESCWWGLFRENCRSPANVYQGDEPLTNH